MDDVIELESIPTKIKYKGIVWIPKSPAKVNHSSGCIKQNYFIKWINDNKYVGDIFTLDEFYEKHPKHKKERGCRTRLIKTISDLIADKALLQLNDNKFKVLKK